MNNAATWNRTLWRMRFACPLVMVAAAALGYLAWFNESYLLVAVNAFLCGFNVVLTWVQWVVLQPRREAWK